MTPRMAILLILALLGSGIPAAIMSMPCPRCCDEARAEATVPDVPPCCRLSPDTPPLVARPAPAGPVAGRPAAAGHVTALWPTPPMILASGVMPPLHAAPRILRI